MLASLLICVAEFCEWRSDRLRARRRFLEARSWERLGTKLELAAHRRLRRGRG